MALLTEALLVSGVALDLVGAGVLSHAHNAESIVELREDIGAAGAVLVVGLAVSLAFTRFFGRRIRDQAHRAADQRDPEALPEQ